MADVFEQHPAWVTERPKLWDLIDKTPHLDWLILTKRPENIPGMLDKAWSDRLFGCLWLGTSVENQDYLWRIDELRKVPARFRFISYEPALGPLTDVNLTGIHWLIYGGESGKNRRPDNDDWARSIRDQCMDQGVAFWYKQASGLKPGTRPTLDGHTYHGLPA